MQFSLASKQKLNFSGLCPERAAIFVLFSRAICTVVSRCPDLQIAKSGLLTTTRSFKENPDEHLYRGDAQMMVH